MWSFIDNFDLLPNLNVKSVYKDGVLMRHDVAPAEGYILRIKDCDECYYDEPNGKKLLKPYRTKGEAILPVTYDFATNPKGIIAELYIEGMENEVLEVSSEEATETDYINALERLGVNFDA